MDRKAFYEDCSRILGTSHAYEAPRHRKINRWNNRRPGNGRFPGYGLIRAFGPRHIQIALRQPVELNLLCHSEEEALVALETQRAKLVPAGPEVTLRPLNQRALFSGGRS